MNIIRNSPRWGTMASYVALLGILAVTPPGAMAQEDTTTTGTIASVSRNTLTLKSGNGPYQLFTLDRNTRKPAQLAVGSEVRVTAIASDEPGVRLATQISAIDSNSANQSTSDNSGIVPPEVRRIERDIERQARRFQLGVRTGVALDPELVLIGAQVQIGPFFSDNVFFRPNIEFAFGQQTESRMHQARRRSCSRCRALSRHCPAVKEAVN